MRTGLALTAALVLCGCATMSFLNDNFYDCAYEAEKASIGIHDGAERQARRNDFTAACMQARGFKLQDAAKKSNAESYKRERWF